MKSAAAASVIAALAQSASASEASTSPVSKVLDLLGSLQAKIISEGETAQKEYDSFAEWCEDRNANVDFEIKTGKSEIASLKATIEEETALASALDTKIEELAASIATDTADLQAATEIRNKENSDFATEEKELVEVVDTLKRAIAILEREMAKGGAAMVQLKQAQTVFAALKTMVDASMFSQADAKQLTAFVQSSQQADEDADADDELTGAPAAAVYEGHSDGIIDTLSGLLEKAETQLADARQKEQTALHNYEMLKQSLDDQIKFANKDTAEAKKNLAASKEKKAVAEGDLSSTSADLAEDEKTKSTLHQDCLTKAQDFEAATKSRGEELKALAEAKKVISETTSGAAALSYGLNQVSFLQLSSGLSSAADLAKFEAVRLVRDLAKQQNSPALAQLASQMASAMHASSDSADPFAKVKGLISDMIEKLESQASSDASHKAYCDEELAESNEKKADKEAEIAKLTTKIDQASSRSAQLKEEVATLQKELSDMAKAQAEADKMRADEKATFTSNKADMDQGLEGIKMALKVLREYYAKDDKAHTAAEGTSSSIVGLLEVVESDFSKGLAEMVSTEEAAQTSYDAATKENQIETATKKKDVEYKTKEYVSLDKAVAADSSDRSGVQAELDAVNEYLGKLEEMCVAKAEPYAERKRRRDAEIEGLKQALEILEGEAVLIQTSKRSLRGVKTHA